MRRIIVAFAALLLPLGQSAEAQIAFSGTTVDLDATLQIDAADVDGDGDIDLLSVHGNTISWWQNSGGSFTEQTIDTSFDGARGVHAADVDGDGDIDVVGSASTDDLKLFVNSTGDGSTWTTTNIDVLLTGVYSATTGDIDGDGDLDIIAAVESDNDVSWWANGIWGETSIDTDFSGARFVAVGDLDGDGDLDVVGSGFDAGSIVTWANNGSGTFAADTNIKTAFGNPGNIDLADMDGDGDLDVIGTSTSLDDVSWFENGNSWAETSIDADLDGASDVDAVDFDGDGDLDVLAVGDDGADVVWYENAGGGTWTQRDIDLSFTDAVSVLAVDIDRDGDPDVLASGQGTSGGDMGWWESSRRGRIVSTGSETTVQSDLTGATSVVAADIDADGDIDLVSAGSATAARLHTSGGGWTSSNIHAGSAGASVAVADIDGDGDLDVISADPTDDDVEWHANSGWSTTQIDASFNGARAVAVGDLDGDGDVDVVAAGGDGNQLSWFQSASSGSSWTERSIKASFNGAWGVAVGDVDGDGNLDVVGTSHTDDDVTLFANTLGTGLAMVETAVDASFNGARSVALGDLDGDGDLDIVAAGDDGNQVSWFENGNSWTEASIATPTAPASVFLADMDSDGDLDVLITANTDDDVIWYANDGSGGTWTATTVDAAFDGAAAAVAADLDSDGDLDVVAAADTDNDVAWWASDTVIGNQALFISGTAGQSNNVGWRLLSVPCSGQTRAGMEGITISGPDEIRRYDESAGATAEDRWLDTASSDGLTHGHGFAAYLYDDGTQEVGATFPVMFPACGPSTANVTATLDVDEEWFLAGNPFLQSFDIESLTMTGHQAVVKLWDPSSGSYTNVTQGGAGDVVPVGQGFFIQRSTVGAGATTITYALTGRTSGGTFVGKRSPTLRTDFVLTVTDDAGHLLSTDRSAALIVRNDVTTGWDRYDSSKRRPLSEQFAALTLVGERAGREEAQSLLSIPLSLDRPLSIPVQVDAQGIRGTAELAWFGLDALPEDWSVELVDLSTGFGQPMRTTNRYRFAVEPSASKTNSSTIALTEARFEIRIAPSATSASAEHAEEFVLGSAYPNPSTDLVQVHYTLPHAAAPEWTVVDLLGRVVRRIQSPPTAAGRQVQTVSVSGLAPGLYFMVLRVQTGQRSMPILVQ
ncbi:MAG: T9SS type A sorting domain-containing protein [Rhodothermales bacterium]|nr:T9SS type A sorting domain-containing protein [Rhodothermales bacterium]MBO6778145.1 T9SS type A sorting domain-containing protein [Rhodothermales bacterium]